MSAISLTLISREEYLRQERLASTRSEYHRAWLSRWRARVGTTTGS